ncbi:MAG: hypothetical protein Q4B85_05015 [Lachnospiraceae bacterium]|nr:hypothetical protein [Lachnospiraceae bacterium]
MKSRQNSLKNQMNATFTAIGKEIFQEYSRGNAISEDMAKLCEKIKRLQKEIEKCASEIEDLKGVNVCDSYAGPVKEEQVEDVDFDTPDEDSEEEDADEYFKEEIKEEHPITEQEMIFDDEEVHPDEYVILDEKPEEEEDDGYVRYEDVEK